MIDPNIQDAPEDDLKTIQFNKAIEEMEKLIKQERSSIDGFMQDIYSEMSEENLQSLRIALNNRNEKLAGFIFVQYWDKYLREEAVRRIE